MSDKNWSELDLIALFKNQPGSHKDSSLIKGIGDDCAVFGMREGCDWITTTDILVENVHFDRSWHPPHLLGRKSIAVNLSDIAAMGGTPHFALVSLAIPASTDKNWIEHWYNGVSEMLVAHNCRLIGGDTAKSDVLTINIVIIGSVTKNRAIMRNSATVGENIYVSGFLGGAGAGLEICKNRSLFKTINQELLDIMINQHLDPQPEIQLGSLLGGCGLIGAMQDLSDGLATDLAHICQQSGVGADIENAALPAPEGLNQVCELIGKSAVSMQISGGEDYKLLFTVKEQEDGHLLSLIETNGMGPIHQIGRIVERTGVRLVHGGKNTDISFQGYQHNRG